MVILESNMPCYVKGTAYELGEFRAVQYEFDRQGNRCRKYWQAYRIKDGARIGGEHTTARAALKAAIKKLKG